MKARLILPPGAHGAADCVVREEATIGRSDENSLVVRHNRVSKKHARIKFDESAQCYVLSDLASHNGTALDGIVLTRPEKLGALHVITLSTEIDVVFVAIREEKTGSAPAPERVLEVDTIAETVLLHNRRGPAQDSTPSTREKTIVETEPPRIPPR